MAKQEIPIWTPEYAKGKLRGLLTEWTPQIPPYVIHSFTDGNFPDGTPYRMSMFRIQWWVNVQNNLSMLIRHDQRGDLEPQLEQFHNYLKKMNNNPADLLELDGSFVVRTLKEDVENGMKMLTEIVDRL